MVLASIWAASDPLVHAFFAVAKGNSIKEALRIVPESPSWSGKYTYLRVDTGESKEFERTEWRNGFCRLSVNSKNGRVAEKELWLMPDSIIGKLNDKVLRPFVTLERIQAP